MRRSKEEPYSRDQLVTITELARMRGTTIETLRHYDRIGLLSPVAREELTGQRLYALDAAHDRIGTILELRKLGLSLTEIKDYFDQRHVGKSYQILSYHREVLHNQVVELSRLLQTIDRKLDNMGRPMTASFETGKPFLRELPRRRFLSSGTPRSNYAESYIDSMALDAHMSKDIRLLGDVVYALLYHGTDGDANRATIGVLLDERDEGIVDRVQTIEGGAFACVYRTGMPFEPREPLAKLRAFCEDQGLVMTGDLVEVIEVDQGLTDVEEELVSQFQVPVAPRDGRRNDLVREQSRESHP